jgi:predicted nucleotidyltransferase
VAEAAARVELRGALLAGSAGRGDADRWSDVDLLLYVDEVPPESVLDELADAVGGTIVKRKEPLEYFVGADLDVGGVLTEVGFLTVDRVDWQLDQLLDELQELGSPYQRLLIGMLEGLPLYGAELVQRWQQRIAAFPEPLRRALVEHYWHFFPLWHEDGWVAARDAELFRLDSLLEGAFNLLGALAALNRRYFARFHLKRTHAFVAQLERKPHDLAVRLESLFRLEPGAAAEELERLVAETQALLEAEFPELDFSLEHLPGTRRQPWMIPGGR